MKYSNSDRFGVVLACLAGVMAIVLFLVEKTPFTVVTLLILMVLLATYPVMHFIRRSTWRGVTLLAIVGCTVLFGHSVWPHKESPRDNVITVTRHDVEKQLAPEQLKVDAKVSATVKHRASSEVKKAKPLAQPAQSCPNGICIGGDNSGVATVNNYGPQLPHVTWNFDMSAVKPNAAHPQQCVVVHIDRTFLDAKFAVVCDRGCKAVSGSAMGKGGYYQSDWGSIPNHPEVAAFVVNSPNPMPANDIYRACVESPDTQPVNVVAVKTLTIDPNAKP